MSEDELYLLRLRLDESGKGEAAYAFGEQSPRLFGVRSWTYGDGRIEIALENADESSLEVPTLGGVLVGSEMKLMLSGKGWSRRIDLRLEGALEQRWLKLKEKMAAPSS